MRLRADHSELESPAASHAARRAVRPLAVLVMLAGACGATTAAADSFRCGTRLIREGMTAAEIEARCGSPDAKHVTEEPIFARGANGVAYRVGVTLIEHWTYDRGPGRFPAAITVEDGKAKKIELTRR